MILIVILAVSMLAACDAGLVASAISEYAAVVIGVGATAILGVIGRQFSNSVFVRGMLERLVIEAKAVVLETEQVYVDAITAARADGVLTTDEAAGAKARAMKTLRANLGAKGLARLARILGIDDAQVERILGTHVESAVAQLSLVQAAGTTMPTTVTTMSTPPLSSFR